MGRRRTSEENIRKIQKVSRSYYVTIPISFIREFGWREGQKLVVEKNKKGEIIIKDWKP